MVIYKSLTSVALSFLLLYVLSSIFFFSILYSGAISTQFVVVNFRIVPNLPIHHVPDFLQVVWVSVYLLAIRVLKTTKPPQSTRADGH